LILIKGAHPEPAIFQEDRDGTALDFALSDGF